MARTQFSPEQTKQREHLQQGLQRAIQAALEKEARLNGTWEDPNKPHEPVTTYIFSAHIHINGGVKIIRHNDQEVFKAAVSGIKVQFPNVPITLFVRGVRK